jgi:argininosuccinate lyase
MASHSNDEYQLWGGRFDTSPDLLMKLFNNSLPIDKRLWKEDIFVCYNRNYFHRL